MLDMTMLYDNKVLLFMLDTRFCGCGAREIGNIGPRVETSKS